MTVSVNKWSDVMWSELMWFVWSDLILKWSQVSYGEVLGDKNAMYIRVTLYWGYLIILWLFNLGISCTVFILTCTVVVLTCFVMCVGVLVICVVVFLISNFRPVLKMYTGELPKRKHKTCVLVCTVFCIVCTVFFVLFLLCIFILICFVCTSLRTTTIEWQLNGS